MTVEPSQFASNVRLEGAFEVLAVAKRLIASGKDVIELEIGDSPFPSSPSAAPAALAAVADGQTRYSPSLGIAPLREAAARYANQEYGFKVAAENILVGPGAKNFQQLAMELLVNPGDGVLVFTPHFPTYEPNIQRRGARMVLSRLRHDQEFRPNLDDVESFLQNDPSPKCIILNSPHNPTGGVSTRSDLQAIAELVRGRNVGIFSDEPYDRMVWNGKHCCIGAIDGMIDHVLTAFTFSKSFSMSGWRLGFLVGSKQHISTMGKLTNAAISCVSPFTQMAGAAALQNDLAICDRNMGELKSRVEQLVGGLNSIDGIECLMPSGTFYAFPKVQTLCEQMNLTSQGLAMYLLEGADEHQGVACLGGECFGAAGQGFLRFTVTEPLTRLEAAVDFIREAITRSEQIEQFRLAKPDYALS